jgi:hypothetical protein
MISTCCRFLKIAEVRSSARPFGLCRIALILVCGTAALAQQPLPGRTDSLRRPAAPVPADTVLPLQYSFAQSPERADHFTDTLPDTWFRMYDPARRQRIDWGTLGNLGSSARPLLFEIRPQRGFDAGIHPFRLYNLAPSDLRFFRNRRTFSEVYFAQGRTQFDGLVGAVFTRTFEKGLSIAVDYRSINNLGQYQHQRDRHNALAIGVWLPLGKRYQGFLTYATNTNRQQESGGIVTDTIFGEGQFNGPLDAEIRLPDRLALTRNFDWTVQLNQYLDFTGSPEGGSRVFRATHQAAYGRQVFKFASPSLGETPSAADSGFFAGFITDPRGLRHYLSIDRLENHFTLATFRSREAKRPSDVLSAGVRHTLFWINQEPEASTLTNLFLTGSLQITPSDRFGLQASGDFGLLDNFGEYRASGELSLGLGKAGRLSAGLLSQRRPPALIERRLFVTKQLVYGNDFVRPLENSLWGAYALPLIGLRLEGRAHVVNNFIYYGVDARPAQTTAPVQVVQFLVTENLRFGVLRLDNTVALQRYSRSDVLRLPEWFTKNSLYFDGKLFKRNLHLQFGFDFRLNSEFRPDGYQPLHGQFHLQDSLTQQPYPWLDAFAAFKIRTFRFFVRYENLRSIWEPGEVFYQTARYPLPFQSIRIGIAWRFLDDNRTDNTAAGNSPPGGRPTGIGEGGF